MLARGKYGIETHRIVGQLVVKGLHVGMGPPPPGTLLRRLDAEAEVLATDSPAMAAVTTRVKTKIRIINFINGSPGDMPYRWDRLRFT